MNFKEVKLPVSTYFVFTDTYDPEIYPFRLLSIGDPDADGKCLCVFESSDTGRIKMTGSASDLESDTIHGAGLDIFLNYSDAEKLVEYNKSVRRR